jgi:hypothetical protein
MNDIRNAPLFFPYLIKTEYSCNNPIISRFVARYDEIQINNLHTNSIDQTFINVINCYYRTFETNSKIQDILIFALAQYE